MRQPTVDPPAGAQDFSFGEAMDAAEKLCRGHGATWAKMDEDFACSGTAVDIGGNPNQAIADAVRPQTR